MSVGHQWNDAEGENLSTMKENLTECHFVYNKSHNDRPGIESGPLWVVADD